MQFGCNLTEFLGKHRGVICNQVWSSQNWAMHEKTLHKWLPTKPDQILLILCQRNDLNTLSHQLSMTPSRDIASPDLESATSAPHLRLNSFSRWIRTGPRQVSWAKHKGVLVDKIVKPQMCCMIQATKYMNIFSWYSQDSQNHDVLVQGSPLKLKCVFIPYNLNLPLCLQVGFTVLGIAETCSKQRMDGNNLNVNVPATLTA